MVIKEVVKREGYVQKFDEKRIYNAILRAFIDAGKKDEKKVEEVTKKVVEELEKRFKEKAPHVEEIQDIVEEMLMKLDEPEVAKKYILYRKERERIREEKKKILNKEILDVVDKKFGLNALRVLTSRYLEKDDEGRIIESPKELFTRVAVHIGIVDLLHDPEIYDKEGKQEVKEINEEGLNLEWYKKELEKNNPLRIGKYPLNYYNFEGLRKTYKLLNSEGKMKKTFKEVVEMIKEGALDKYEKIIDEYYTLMVEKKFMPNTPALANFGRSFGMGSACFVLDIEDSLDSIMSTLKDAALIFQAGGGCGYNFSKLRPKGDVVRSSKGIASGPISFMTLYDKMTEVINQGGIRRGANMGILNIDHPDIEDFIRAKEKNKALKNFNISVLIKPEFWKHLEEGKPWPLVNPRDGKVWKYVDPKELFEMIAFQARNYAEPGVLFMDNINKYNPLLEALGPITTTNPCGEVILYPNESCNLGSINVWAFVKEKNGKKELDWDELAKAVKIATRFLDNIIDVNKYPIKKIEEMTRKTRKIGLGVMGVGDLFYELGIRYDSEEGLKMMEKIMEFINFYSKKASIELAKERGSFPLFEKSFYPEGKLPIAGFYNKEDWHLPWEEISEEVKKGIRNAFTTVIAPTGSISMIAETSSGIEPVFSLVFEKRVVVGTFFYIDPVFERTLKEKGLYSEELLHKISENRGSVKNIEEIPKDMQNIFVTAMDISAEMHVRAQAAFQKWVDSSISKTINMPSSATVEDVKNAYYLAHKLGCKGLTVYRDGSIEEQVLVAGKKKEENDNHTCPVCGGKLEKQEGCETCKSCGWSKCTVA